MLLPWLKYPSIHKHKLLSKFLKFELSQEAQDTAFSQVEHE
jgi:hypothetical protein